MPEVTHDPAVYPYRVRYYNAVMSRKGQGVQCRVFKTFEEAETFASANRLYNKPCRVEEQPAERWDST